MIKEIRLVGEKFVEFTLIKMNRASVQIESKEYGIVNCTRRVFNIFLSDNFEHNFEVMDRNEKGQWLAVWEPNVF